MAEDFAKEENLIFLCGHYEGIDERVLEEIVTDEVSIGDYVLTGGELPAMVMIAPLLLFLGFASKSFTNAAIACALFFVLWLAYTIFLFRRRIFKKRYKDTPVTVWEEEKQ